MKFLLRLCVVAALLASLYVVAYAGYLKFGGDATGQYNSFCSGIINTGRVTPDSTGVIDSLGAWFVSPNGASKFGVAIYAWRGASAIDSAPRFSHGTSTSTRYVGAAYVGATVTAGTWYGICVMGEASGNSPNSRESGTGHVATDTLAEMTHTYGAWPTSTTWGGAYHGYFMSAFVVYHTTGGAPPAAGRTGRRRIIQIGENGTTTEEDIGPWIPDTTKKVVAAK